ncbi:MAG: carbohydrate ABC transporter permease [Oscillospiraceae bacterium]|nr:carbohydrate ABC transporter permease [Oscillospiraceae bacterium]
MKIKTNILKRKTSDIAVTILRYVFFLSLSYILLYPLLYIVVNAVKSYSDAYDATVTWVPKSIYFGNIISALTVFDVKNTMLRTIVYEIGAALIQFCSCAITAYGLARFKLKGKSLMMGLMVLNILVPSMMTIIPSYINYSSLDFFGILGLISKIIGKDIRPNVIGTPMVFYLPSLFGVGLKGGLFIYIFTQFFKGFPKEIEEAAAIDGAGAWKAFLRIVIPSSRSAIITVLLFSVIWHWNDLYLAQMYLNEYTFATAINNFGAQTIAAKLGMDLQTSNAMLVPILLSGCLVFILPLLIFYIVIQRKFMASIATSGIVG